MNDHPPSIRRLHPGEGELYRRVRLESLRESPEAFASTYESALARTEESWAAQADSSSTGNDRATFIVLAEERSVGLAALYRDESLSDVGEMIQVWIAPDFRGGTLATHLLDAIFDWASSNGFETIRAEVTPTNQRALGFYGKYGFSKQQEANTAIDGNLILIKKV